MQRHLLKRKFVQGDPGNSGEEGSKGEAGVKGEQVRRFDPNYNSRITRFYS